MDLSPLRTLLMISVLLVWAGCGRAPAPPSEVSDEGAFITLLGEDTLAVERFTKSPHGMEATVLLRTPETTLRRYVFETEEGRMRRFETTVREPGAPEEDAPLRREIVTADADSLRFETTAGSEAEVTHAPGQDDMLPFIDMIHWPFELMLQRAYAAPQDSVTQELFTERGVMPFVVRRLASDSMTIQHPYRGTMGVRVDDRGRLQVLDAAGTTRALVVRRVPSADVEALARSFAKRDAAGRSFGPLSTRETTSATVDGATITVDYGVPYKRGRAIFGTLVPWHEVWRTGANRATHFSTSRALKIGDLAVPAGEYTLFSVPEPTGGQLIINKQTGQNGTAYDPNQDLGRVAMERTALNEPVEAFTITVAPAEEGGKIALQWDQTAFTVPFTVEEDRD